MKGLQHVATAISLMVALASTEACGQSEVVGQAVEADNPMVDEGVQLYVTPVKPDKSAERIQYETDYPEIFKTPAVVAYFGATHCPPCIPQKRELKSQVDDYNIVFYTMDKQPKAAALLKKWKPDDMVTPYTFIVVDGQPVASFRGYTPWENIKEAAKPARKADAGTHIDAGPLHIDIDEDKVDVDIRRRDERREWFSRERGNIIEAYRIRRETHKGMFNEWFQNLDFDGMRERIIEFVELSIEYAIEHREEIMKMTVMLFMLL